jgi:hypothetical protein
VPYVEPLSDVRTKLEDFFNILLGMLQYEPLILSDACQHGWSRGPQAWLDSWHMCVGTKMGRLRPPQRGGPCAQQRIVSSTNKSSLHDQGSTGRTGKPGMMLKARGDGNR